MASISTDGKTGNRTIQFVGRDRKRRSIRLGGVTKKQAESIRSRVESLHAASIAGLAWDADLSAWVSSIGDELAAKLSAVGLIPSRTSRTLATFLDAYLNGRRSDGATARGTLDNIEQVRNDLVTHFGADLDLRALTREKAEGFKLFYQTTCGLATTTVARRLGAVRTIFESGVRSEVLPANPFSRVSGQYIPRKERSRYVPVDDILKVLDVTPPVWRTIVALSRFAGLRCPSEVLSIRWADINFAEGKMTVPEPKNARHPGREYRIVPIFHRLRSYLQDAYDLAPAGEEFVISGPLPTRLRNAVGFANGIRRARWKNANLGKRFKDYIRRACLTPWPRVFHNMRASFETDLTQSHPIHVVSAWLGNSPKIALAHYLQVVPGDFAKAVAGGAESGAVVVQIPVQATASGGEHLNSIGGEKIEEGRENESEPSFLNPGTRTGSSGGWIRTSIGLLNREPPYR